MRDKWICFMLITCFFNSKKKWSNNKNDSLLLLIWNVPFHFPFKDQPRYLGKNITFWNIIYFHKIQQNKNLIIINNLFHSTKDDEFRLRPPIWLLLFLSQSVSLNSANTMCTYTVRWILFLTLIQMHWDAN